VNRGLEAAPVGLVTRLVEDHPDEMIGVVATPERARLIALGIASNGPA